MLSRIFNGHCVWIVHDIFFTVFRKDDDDDNDDDDDDDRDHADADNHDCDHDYDDGIKSTEIVRPTLYIVTTCMYFT